MALIRLFSVEADPTTGEWLGEPQQIGTIDEDALRRQVDTDDANWDIFERDGVTCGIRVTWPE